MTNNDPRTQEMINNGVRTSIEFPVLSGCKVWTQEEWERQGKRIAAKRAATRRRVQKMIERERKAEIDRQAASLENFKL